MRPPHKSPQSGLLPAAIALLLLLGVLALIRPFETQPASLASGHRDPSSETAPVRVRPPDLPRSAPALAPVPVAALPARPVAPLFSLAARLPRPEIPDLPPPGEPVPSATLAVKSSSVLSASSIRQLSSLGVGSPVSFPAPEGGWIEASVSGKTSADGRTLVSGRLNPPARGHFSLASDGGALSGVILDPAKDRAFLIQSAPGGRTLLQEKTLQSVVCSGMPREPGYVPRPKFSGPVANITVPNLDSIPAATHVFYLDFDGEVVTDPLWPSDIDGSDTINALPATLGGRPITPEQITQVWEAVAEDFRPFNISVTTIKSRYTAAGIGRRMRCIITPTNDAATSAGGVAYLNSYSNAGTGPYSPDIPCWSFNENNVRNMVMTISHELGHTVGLSHDGYVDSEGRLEYYQGHGSGATSWGPLMGAPFGRPVTQWSKGDYTGRTNPEDDLAIITRTVNGFGYRGDDIGNTTGSARNVRDLVFGNFDDSGIITDGSDVDIHRFTSGNGPINVTVSPRTTEPNLDIILELLDSSGAVIATANPSTTLSAAISRPLTLGVYFLAVRRTGTGFPLAPNPTGYDPYGSLGSYQITGTFTPLPQIPTIVNQPVPPPSAVVEGNSVSFTVDILSNTAVKYQWVKKVGALEQDIPGATGKTYRIAAVNATHIAEYKVRVSNSIGPVNSDWVPLDVILKPRVVSQPPDSTFPAGSTRTLSVGAIGTPGLNYQWFKNNQPFGTNSATLQFDDVQWSDAGSYRVEITNSVGKAVSRTAVVTINSAPVFLTDPPLMAVASGGRATLSYPIVGSPKFTYQWFKDGIPVAGATKPSLSLPGVPASLGVYRLQVTNSFGSASNTGTSVVVDDRMLITEHPAGASLLAGQTHTFNVEHAGTNPVTYQWQQNRKNIPGATQKTLQLNNLGWFANGRYRVIVSNRVSSAVSKETTLSVVTPPEITIHPANTKAANGGSATLSVTAAGTAKLSYQWRKGGVPIPGATSPKLSLKRLNPAAQGQFDVVVTNPQGSVTSDPASLVIEDAPVIVLQPQPGAFAVGSSIVLSVSANGSPNLRYQWQKGSRNLVGQESPTLTIPNAQAGDSAAYRVIVSNDVGKVTSRSASARVMIPPAITTQPVGGTVYEGQSFTFSVKVSGTGPFTYRWFRDGTQVSTASSLRLTNISADKDGSYRVEVSNPVGMASSSSASLDVLLVPPPVITGFTPTQGPAGSKIAIFGSQLRFARSVSLAGQPMSFVVVNNGELIATAPTAGASSGLIRVSSRGGVATSANSFSVISSVNNDNFEDSMIISGSDITTKAITTSYTRQFGEPGHAGIGSYRSAWWRWIAPSTAAYQLSTGGSTFDTTLSVYTGNSLSNLVPVASNDDAAPYLTSAVTLSAVKGVAYRIALDGYAGDSGIGILRIFPASNIPLASVGFEQDQGFEPGQSAAGKGLWQGLTSSTTIVPSGDGQSAVIGGEPAGSSAVEPAQIWHPAIPDGVLGSGSVTTSFSAGLNLPSGATSTDSFHWTLYNSEEAPLLALSFSADTGAIQVTNAAGDTSTLPQSLVSGSALHFEITTHLETGLWSLLIDGVTVLDSQPLGLTIEKPDFKDISASWNPAADGPRASMFFDDLHISASKP